MTEDTSTIVEMAHARAGLLGNPSDGYGGRTISIIIRNFSAKVTIRPSDELVIEPGAGDGNVHASLRAFGEKIDRYGYGGGDRLVMAALKRFRDHCLAEGIALDGRNFTIAYESDIPRQVGLAGSSAIVTAALRALVRFFGVGITDEVLPVLALEAETRELGIVGGLQDRVVQILEGCVYMDFDPALASRKGGGVYERLDPALLPGLYIAYRPELSKVSGRVLDAVRTRFEEGDTEVVVTLQRIADLAKRGREAIVNRDRERLAELMNENFDLRQRIMKISDANMEMVRTARSLGASAKFAGSGGSIVGLVEDDRMYARLKSGLEKIGACVVRPRVA